jgi:gliding motility associated protien GldN
MKKKIILLIAILNFGSLTFAQNLFNAKSPQDVHKDALVKDADGNLVKEGKKPLSYAYISDRDVMWSTTVWEKMDLSQKLNLPYYFPVDTNAIDAKRRSLYDALIRGIKNGEITEVYEDDYFTQKISFSEIAEFTSRTDTLDMGKDLLNADSSADITDYITVQDVKSENVSEFRLKGIWYFDKRIGEMKYRLLAIAPVGEELRDPSGTYDSPPDRFALFWVWYPDAREVLYKAKVFNPNNTSFSLSFDDLLNARRFEATIYKEDNIYGDRAIQDYVKTSAMFQLLEGEKIKSRIRDFEIDMWSY